MSGQTRPTEEAPPNWSKDKLTGFFEHARQNAFATFFRLKRSTGDLIEIDRLLSVLAESIENSGKPMEAMFLLRAHSAHRAAAYLAMSGQIVESFAQNRVALECALFGMHMHKKPGTDEMWLNRSDSKEMAKKVRDEFSTGNVFRTLKTTDTRLHAALSKLYETCVSYGGHPLEEGFMAAMQKTKRGTDTVFQQVYSASDGQALRLGIRSTAQVGIGLLKVFRNIWKERMALLDLDRPLDKIATRY